MARLSGSSLLPRRNLSKQSRRTPPTATSTSTSRSSTIDDKPAVVIEASSSSSSFDASPSPSPSPSPPPSVVEEYQRPSHHTNDQGTGFKNPWKSASAPSWFELISGGSPVGWAKKHLHRHERARKLKVVEPDWGYGEEEGKKKSQSNKVIEDDGEGEESINDVSSSKGKSIKEVKEEVGLLSRPGKPKRKILGTWLGHAGAYIEIPLEDEEDARHRSKATDEEHVSRAHPSTSAEPASYTVSPTGPLNPTTVPPSAIPKAPEGRRRSPPSGIKTMKFLFDPIFSSRAGPVGILPLPVPVGPLRMRDSPCQIEDLPGVDCVLISHNHYDHLDYATIASIHKYYPNVKYFVPLNLRHWFQECKIPSENIIELDWWMNYEIPSYEGDFGVGFGVEGRRNNNNNNRSAGLQQESTTNNEGGKGQIQESRIRITCVPAQHNSGRSPADFSSTLWCGWIVENFVTQVVVANTPVTKRTTSSSSAAAATTLLSPSSLSSSSSRSRVTRKGAIYHAGDTGYRRYKNSEDVCPAFEEIGNKFGPIDLSFIPIWRGGTLGFVSQLGLRLSHENIPASLHGSPEDAVYIHIDVKSRHTVGMHFGTFIGHESESLEAIIELHEACEDLGVSTQLPGAQPFTEEADSIVSHLPISVREEMGTFGIVDLGVTVQVEVEDLVIA